jgi:hypothetical protein
MFDFYDEDEDSILFEYMKNFSVSKLNNTMYITLVDYQIENYDHESEVITIDGQDEADELSGMILYANLV